MILFLGYYWPVNAAPGKELAQIFRPLLNFHMPSLAYEISKTNLTSLFEHTVYSMDQKVSTQKKPLDQTLSTQNKHHSQNEICSW